MSWETTTVPEFYSDVIGPFLSALGVPQFAVDAVENIATSDAFKNVKLISLGVDLSDLLSAPASGGDGPPNLLPQIPPLQPIDPSDALRAVAAAIKDAEATLNPANLAIGGASAEVTLTVQIGGVAGANAVLKLNIGPTPSP